ncbi:hypothetical protein B1H10_08235 [candidate division KSB1 bacterium 4484_188]|nr:MAG: hypothetical protein B1H10_08235 [candidate division KSB1 bacterium 4484_188]
MLDQIIQLLLQALIHLFFIGFYGVFVRFDEQELLINQVLQEFFPQLAVNFRLLADVNFILKSILCDQSVHFREQNDIIAHNCRNAVY